MRIILMIFLFFMACNGHGQKKETPKHFINDVIVAPMQYSRDSIAMLDDLYSKLRNHEASFANSEYFDSTVLIIDTIMYDSSLNKVALFVLAENPRHRNPYLSSKLPRYYNANCYLGKRLSPGLSSFELKCLCRFSEINFDDKLTAIKALKEDFFFELSTVLDEDSKPVFEYNLNDKRFWNSPTGWLRLFN